MKNTIKCSHCGEEIEISQALTHQIEESAKEEFDKKLKLLQEKTEKELQERLEKKYQEKIKSNENERDEERKRASEQTKQIQELLTQIRELKRKEEEKEILMTKKLMEVEEKIRKEAQKTAQESSQFKILELEKQLNDTKKALDQANYKVSQKSQQLQGEVLELNLELLLKESFPQDEISGVAKGVQGADVIQKVKGRSGRIAGTILWETKRAKWSNTWLIKLRDDARKEGATTSILVSENLPEEVENFKFIDGVLVTNPSNAIALASLVRKSLGDVAIAKQTAANKDERLEFLYQYLASEDFRHRFESFAEGISQMHEDLLSEKRSMERVWKKREFQINRMMTNTARMYGELQGVMGNSLPEIKTLSFGEDQKEEESGS